MPDLRDQKVTAKSVAGFLLIILAVAGAVVLGKEFLGHKVTVGELPVSSRASIFSASFSSSSISQDSIGREGVRHALFETLAQRISLEARDRSKIVIKLDTLSVPDSDLVVMWVTWKDAQ